MDKSSTAFHTESTVKNMQQQIARKTYEHPKTFLPNLNSIEYSLTVFVHACRVGAGCCNKCVHS